MTTIGSVLALAGMVLLVAALAYRAQNKLYIVCTEETRATVTGKQRRNKRSHVLTVSYSVQGVPFENAVGAAPEEWAALSVGDQIPLQYKPSDPRIAVRPRKTFARASQTVLILGVILMAVGMVLTYLGSK